MWQRMFVVLTTLFVFSLVTAASAEQRLALVIGNSAYEKNSPLSNPQNDAQAVAQLLNNAGFEVVMAFDLTRDIMKQTIEEFAARIGEKGDDSAALVYYAGHGLQVDGENYLVPVDAKLEKEEDLAQNGVKLADVMGALQSAPSKIRIVILDACRDNPFSAAGSGGRGLAMVDAPAGTIVAYSTAPGTQALDGTGKHSPFAAAFMRIVKQPDLPIEQVFKKVRRLVNDSTDNKQTPWESSSLTSDFVFFSSLVGSPATSNSPAGGNAPAAANVSGGGGNSPGGGRASGVPAGARVERVTVADLGSRPAIQAYDIVIEEDSPEYYEEFIRLYPNDPLAAYARRKLALRKEMIEWQNVTYRNTPDAYASFASRFQDGAMLPAARKLQDRPRPIEIALPRRGDPRLNIGDFGSFRINRSRDISVINFPRGRDNDFQRGRDNNFQRGRDNNPGQNSNRNRDPVIPFQRNQGQNQNQNQNKNQNQNQNQNANQNQNKNQNQNQNSKQQANLPNNNNVNQQKSKLDQNRNSLQDRKVNAKQNNESNNRSRENLRNARGNERVQRSRIENRGVVRNQNTNRVQNVRSQPREQNVQRANFRPQQNIRPQQNFRPQQQSVRSSSGGSFGGGGGRRR